MGHTKFNDDSWQMPHKLKFADDLVAKAPFGDNPWFQWQNIGDPGPDDRGDLKAQAVNTYTYALDVIALHIKNLNNLAEFYTQQKEALEKL